MKKGRYKFLTKEEGRVMDHLNATWRGFNAAIPKGPNRKADMAEATAAIHTLQGLLARLVAARVDPKNWRLLGLKFKAPKRNS